MNNLNQFKTLTNEESLILKGGGNSKGDTLFCEWYVSKTDNTQNAMQLAGADAAQLKNNDK